MIAEYTDYSCTNIMLWVLYLEFPFFAHDLLCPRLEENTCVESWSVLYKVPHVFSLFIYTTGTGSVRFDILDLCTKDAICNGYWGDKGKRSMAKLKYQ